MPELEQGGGPVKPPKEMSMEVRLLLAFLLMGVVMFVTPYVFKSQAPPAAPKKAAAGQTAAPASPAPAQPAPAEQTAKAQPAGAARQTASPALAETPQRVLAPLVIETNLFRVVLSNQGANLRSWELKAFKGNDRKPLELMNTASGLEYPLSFYIPAHEDIAKKANWSFYEQTADADGLGVSYVYSDGHISVKKTFRFEKNSYISRVSAEVSVDGNLVSSMLTWRGGFGDLTVANPAANGKSLYFSVTDNKLVAQAGTAAKNGPITTTGSYSFAGVSDTFFSAVFLPQGDARVQQTTFSNTVRTALDPKPLPFAGIAVSDGASNRFELYVGPKDLDLLRSVNPKLEQLVDFGSWIGVLAKPLFLITNWLNNAFVHSFGWAIVLVTIALNFVLFPLKFSNMKSMRKMQALKPQIDAINLKYKSVGLRDPRKADQNTEVMDLYKKNGVNPMGGCFPMLLQIPFFFAFYRVFTVSVEMRGASWLWVTDLSQAEQLPIHILPIIMIVSQFMMQKMTPQPTQDPAQAKMMMFMPLIFGFMFYYLPSGLVLYYLTSNLVNMGQQWFFNRTAVASQAALSVEPPKKRNGRT